jgi:hypothetical protein
MQHRGVDTAGWIAAVRLLLASGTAHENLKSLVRRGYGVDIAALALNLPTKLHRPDSVLLTDDALQIGKFLGRGERKPLGIEASTEVHDGDLPAIRDHKMCPHARVQESAL